MARVDKFFTAWNAGRVREAVSNVSDDYWYQDSVLGGPHDRNAHVEIMEQVLAMYPDRRADVRRITEGANIEIVEYRWTGTSAADAQQLEADWVAVVEFRGAQMRSQRHYRGS